MGTVHAETVSPVTPLRRPLGVCGVIAVFLAVLIASSPRLVNCQWLRFSDPMGNHPPYSRLMFSVQPGDTRVIFASAVDVQATTSGAIADRMDLVFIPAGGAEEVVPMFPEGDGNWRATLADVETPGVYFLRSGRARTQRFNLEVITVPQIQKVTFHVSLPAYTNRPPYEGPLPQSGLSGLPGTKVVVHAQSNRPLSGGQLILSAAGAVQKIQMTASAANEATGEFEIQAPGRFEVKVIDTDGQISSDSFSGSILLLKDEKPFVRMVEPYATSFATPDAMVKVLAVAEDDYGISKLEIYRNVNDSRFRPDGLTVPTPAPTQFQGSMMLPLAGLGLVPSDVIKLFARTEDNDPAGPKGTESTVVTIHIISQAEMDRMQMTRDALQVLESKYAQAARRLEALKAQADQLRKEIAAQDPGKPLSDAQRKKLDQLSRDLAKAAEDIKGLAGHDLPIDLDRALKPQLQELSAAVKNASQLAGECDRPGLSAAGALDKLDQLRKSLGAEKENFNKNATQPLEYLAKIYPLMEDQMRFIDIYNRQKDLAERMASLETKGHQDAPELKARMRDLQDEQHQIQDDLGTLLDDIDSHVNALPEDKRLDQLRTTARNFAHAVRQSPAEAQMEDAQAALGQFDGTAAENSDRSAENTLNGFIAQCHGMGNSSSICLRFQPELSAGLGDSIDQMLSLGSGSGGGYSTARNSMDNIGLYGTIPLISSQSSGGGGEADRGLASSANGSPNGLANPDAAGAQGKLEASGAGDAPIPPQYKQRVGEYFQRVEDELSQ